MRTFQNSIRLLLHQIMKQHYVKVTWRDFFKNFLNNLSYVTYKNKHLAFRVEFIKSSKVKIVLGSDKLLYFHHHHLLYF